MILCADVGNTSIKLALVDRGGVRRTVTLPGAAGRRDLEAALRRLLRGARAPAGCAMSSVRPRADAAVRAALTRACAAAPLEVSHRLRLPIRIAVERPSALGADRICAAVGALGARRHSAIVVDAGTAVTVDLVVDRVFRGGVILPGPALSLLALHAGTAKLPRLDFSRGPFPPGGFGRTERAMQWGAGLSAAGGIRMAVRMLERHAGRRLPVVVTGGAAARLGLLLPARYRSRPHCTLLGLERIARLSK